MSLLALDQLLSAASQQPGGGGGRGGMYLPAEKHQQLAADPYKDKAAAREEDMLIMMTGENNSGGEEHSEVKQQQQPKKRAETWVQDETHCLIALRREMDGHFNTSKSNRHLWEQISAKLREKGYDRSPTMCTDKWRNLLKEFKKAKHHSKGSGTGKMSYYKELDELLKERNRSSSYKSPIPTNSVAVVGTASADTSKVDSYLQFSDKAFEDPSLPFGSAEGSGRSTLSMDRHLESDPALAITAAEAVATNGTNPWNWRDTPTNGEETQAPFLGRVILVKWGEYTKRIGIDGTSDAIKEAIKCAFGLRTRRAFWLEDEDDVVRSFDRDMPLGTYTLHLDEGNCISIKICSFDETSRMPMQTEERTFYTEEDFRDYLSRRGLIGLREFNGFRYVDTLDDLCPGAMYQGVRLIGNQEAPTVLN